MVLSNKKLKQKLREEKAEQLAASELAQSRKDSKVSENPAAEALESIQSLRKSVTQKARLSKREKRREKTKSLIEKVQTLSETNGDEVKNEEDGDGADGIEKGKKKKKEKKRKREDGEGDEVKKEAETTKKAENKKQKKKKWKKKKKKGVEEGGEDGGAVVEAINTKDSNENLDACTKVYVGGIPYYSTEDDIRSYFEGCGTVTEIDCMMFPESGKFRGIAIITFKTEAAAKRALALDGSDMGGLYLKIQPYKGAKVNKTSTFAPASVEGYNKIYVGNLSWDITEDDLRTLFSDCTIKSIKFGEDKETGEFKCYGHVDFEDDLSVNMALKLDQTMVCGRPIKISRAVPKKGATANPETIQQKGSVTVLQSIDSQSTQQTGEITDAQPTQQCNQVNSNEVPAVSSKIRRRTCYECGERGHLSSSCPKKQENDQTNTAAG